MPATDAGIEAVAGIEPPVMVGQRRLRVVKMTDIVLGRIFRASCIEQFPHPVLKLDRIVTFKHDIVLVKHVTEGMPVVELMGDRGAGVSINTSVVGG